MGDRWTDRLSEYLDGALSAAAAAELESHLDECAECASVLADLRRVVARAESLEDRPPDSDLWPGIAARVGFSGAAHEGDDVVDLSVRRRMRRRRVTFTVPQLVAASVAVAVLSGATAWMVVSGGDVGTGGPAAAPPVAVEDAGPQGPRMANFASDPYGEAIADLERVLEERRAELSPETVRVIEENLSKIDRAVREARRALAEDPSSDYLNSHLSSVMRQKLDFLRRAAALSGATS